MEDISLHILDIAENSIRVKAKNINIMIIEDKKNDLLTLTIEDDGEGMDDKTKEYALNPFFTTKKGKKVGLGLAFLSHSGRKWGIEENSLRTPTTEIELHRDASHRTNRKAICTGCTFHRVHVSGLLFYLNLKITNRTFYALYL